MANILASVVITRVRTTLIEPVANYWSDAELLDDLNAGISAVVAEKPDASAVTASFTLAAGAIQSLPAGAVQLIDVLTARKTDKDKLLHVDPTWMSSSLVTNPTHYIYDITNPLTFFNYPRSNGSGSWAIVYSVVPAILTATSDQIPIPDVYQSPLWAFVCSMAYAKNTVRGDMAKSGAYMQMFNAMLGIRTQAQVAERPAAEDEKA